MLVVIVPEELEVLDTTFLFITGSDNTMEWDEDDTSDKIEMASHIAVNNRMVAASLFQVQSMVMSSYLALAIIRQCCLYMRVLSLKVPNQPIVYSDDPLQMERREDESIGWTWWVHTVHLIICQNIFNGQLDMYCIWTWCCSIFLFSLLVLNSKQFQFSLSNS